MNQIDLPVKLRNKNSKNGNRRLRREGALPAVIYGGTQPPQAAVIDGVKFHKMAHTIHTSTIFNLQIEGDGETQKAIIRDVQYHPVTEYPMHVDFYRIQLDKPIIVEVPIHGVGGVPAGVKLGGVLEHVTRRVSVRVLPLQVPEFIEIDISGMNMGQALHVSDLKAPEGVEILTHGEEALFLVQAPKAEEEVKPAEGAEQMQPELIGEKKEEGEEGAAGEKGGEKTAAKAGDKAAADKGGAKKEEKGKPEKKGDKK
ncbi:50S ribosomal protein L25 [Candidatus Sumerlaeota bacterium]|nr:50S ribosomal protein L25 [Candidatus Sumerlaeota bacterium]